MSSIGGPNSTFAYNFPSSTVESDATVIREPMEDGVYDFAVIGGGCGGLAAAKEAASLGAKTILFDYVRPSPRGTTWGLGGTCVNVGCIPKKLMHYAGILGHASHDREALGWGSHDGSHDWGRLVGTVQNYVKMLNFSYRSGLISKSVEYVNALASLADKNTVTFTDKKGQAQQIKAKNVLIAIGTRPTIPSDVKGAWEYSITSDDLMSRKEPVGKTLVVGGSFVALECAGFLTSMGYDVTVAVRSLVLRGFDRQCADKVQELMLATGTKFRNGVVPKVITKLDNGRLRVEFIDGSSDEFDTLMYATGRSVSQNMRKELSAIGVKFSEYGRIIAEDGQTSVEGVYAVGDVVEGNPALAPVAVKDGELLARRIFGNSKKKIDLNYIPMCVFTPYEYARCGISEETAAELYGDDFDVYLKEYTTLEFAAVHREKVESVRNDEYDVDMPPTCLSKMICKKDGTVVGVHFVGPNAGEIIQGLCMAVRKGITKDEIDDTIGIHPTDAESFVNLTVTKRSGESWVSSQGCGGGRCG
ncbi:thioredoxin reductase [Babesia ovata]|uniref:Thioredoxin reductase n=1 Tax=Babesia ovata TaxID=189622 RepID=A0A2H6KE90_9APIC|nr:thioredoxin reductase [Babesia ovata]GBE61306.1 thioredoxin reductase [Babesia ovata]